MTRSSRTRTRRTRRAGRQRPDSAWRSKKRRSGSDGIPGSEGGSERRAIFEAMSSPLSALPEELADLHIHVGGAVAPHVMYSIAHQQGIKLPVKTYWEFVDRVTSSPEKVHNLDEYLAIMHETEKIQSSPAAMERAIYEVIGKEYRSSRVGLIELRFNPMKRNLGGERDLDHIILASLVGMDRACLEYGVKAGLIFC